MEPPELFEWFVESRRRVGIDVIALRSRLAARSSAGRSRRTAVVCLLSDRDLAGNGITVDFFGEETTVPGGPAMLALRTGAALLPGSAYFTAGGGHVARIGAAIPAERRGRLRADVERVTADLVRHMEDAIREAPEQWLLMQPNWPSDRVGRGRRRMTGSARDRPRRVAIVCPYSLSVFGGVQGQVLGLAHALRGSGSRRG